MLMIQSLMSPISILGTYTRSPSLQSNVLGDVGFSQKRLHIRHHDRGGFPGSYPLTIRVFSSLASLVVFPARARAAKRS